MANFINAIKEVVLHLGLDVIAETLENYDEAIRKSPKRSEKWSVVRKDPKQLVTSLGTVQYRKTLFINKTTKERSYLLDRELSLEKHQRITEDAEAQLLTEAVQTTYGGYFFCFSSIIFLTQKDPCRSHFCERQRPSTTYDLIRSGEMEQRSHSTGSVSPFRFLTTPGVPDAAFSCSIRRRTASMMYSVTLFPSFWAAT